MRGKGPVTIQGKAAILTTDQSRGLRLVCAFCTVVVTCSSLCNEEGVGARRTWGTGPSPGCPPSAWEVGYGP